jgi:hypothetical protein
MIRDRFVSLWDRIGRYRAAAPAALFSEDNLNLLGFRRSRFPCDLNHTINRWYLQFASNFRPLIAFVIGGHAGGAFQWRPSRPLGAEPVTRGFSENQFQQKYHFQENHTDVAVAGFRRSSSVAHSSDDSRPSATIAFWLLSAVVLMSVALQVYLGVDTDTSWNITLAEKVLDGARPNIDFIEINPPMSYFIYVAPTLVARLTGLSPEFMVDLFCFAGVGASLYLASAILGRSGVVGQAVSERITFFAALALLLLPARSFAQREHIALIAATPCLAALVICASRARTEPLLGLLAGLGAGLAISIKPHFGLFFLLGFLYAARRSGWRAALGHSSLFAALAFVALYWIAVAACLPAFFERVAPIVSEIYLPARKTFSALRYDPSFAIWTLLAAALALAASKRAAEPFVAIPALASFGAFVAYLIQGKFWPYQAYPAFAFMMLAIGPLVVDWVADPRTSRRYVSLAAAEAVAGLFALAGLWLGQGWDQRDLEKAIKEISPHPTMLAISPDIATGYPLARHVHGVWAGSSFGIWMTSLSMDARAHNPDNVEAARRYDAYMRLDRERLVADITDQKPEVILVPDKQWLGWAESNHDVATALADYDLRADADDTSVFVRRRDRLSERAAF